MSPAVRLLLQHTQAFADIPSGELASSRGSKTGGAGRLRGAVRAAHPDTTTTK